MRKSIKPAQTKQPLNSIAANETNKSKLPIIQQTQQDVPPVIKEETKAEEQDKIHQPQIDELQENKKEELQSQPATLQNQEELQNETNDTKEPLLNKQLSIQNQEITQEQNQEKEIQEQGQNESNQIQNQPEKEDNKISADSQPNLQQNQQIVTQNITLDNISPIITTENRNLSEHIVQKEEEMIQQNDDQKIIDQNQQITSNQEDQREIINQNQQISQNNQNINSSENFIQNDDQQLNKQQQETLQNPKSENGQEKLNEIKNSEQNKQDEQQIIENPIKRDVQNIQPINNKVFCDQHIQTDIKYFTNQIVETELSQPIITKKYSEYPDKMNIPSPQFQLGKYHSNSISQLPSVKQQSVYQANNAFIINKTEKVEQVIIENQYVNNKYEDEINILKAQLFLANIENENMQKELSFKSQMLSQCKQQIEDYKNKFKQELIQMKQQKTNQDIDCISRISSRNNSKFNLNKKDYSQYEINLVNHIQEKEIEKPDPQIYESTWVQKMEGKIPANIVSGSLQKQNSILQKKIVLPNLRPNLIYNSYSFISQKKKQQEVFQNQRWNKDSLN